MVFFKFIFGQVNSDCIYFLTKADKIVKENYAKKLYEEDFVKTSKGYTTTANHLKGI
jgi:hypothetical protein